MPGTLNWLCNVIDFLLTTVTETSSSMLMQAISTDPPTRGWDVAPLFRSVRTSAQLPTIGRSFSPQFRTAFSTPGEGTQVIRGGGRMASPKSRSRCRSMENLSATQSCSDPSTTHRPATHRRHSFMQRQWDQVPSGVKDGATATRSKAGIERTANAFAEWRDSFGKRFAEF